MHQNSSLVTWSFRMNAKRCCLEEVVPKQIFKGGEIGGNHRKISRKEDSEQKGHHVKVREERNSRALQGRTRSRVLLKQEVRSGMRSDR